MLEKFEAGVYLIANKHHRKMLHIKSEPSLEETTSVILEKRDEILYRNQQLWWIERLLTEDGSTQYQILHLPTGMVLEAEYGIFSTGAGGEIRVGKNYGRPYQRWKIERFTPAADDSDNER